MGGEEEVVVDGGLPVDNSDVFGNVFAVVVAVGDFYCIFEAIVNFPVGAGESEGASFAGEFFDGEGDRLFGEVRVEFF